MAIFRTRSINAKDAQLNTIYHKHFCMNCTRLLKFSTHMFLSNVFYGFDIPTEKTEETACKRKCVLAKSPELNSI